jgi:hypothetical protein
MLQTATTNTPNRKNKNHNYRLHRLSGPFDHYLLSVLVLLPVDSSVRRPAAEAAGAAVEAVGAAVEAAGTAVEAAGAAVEAAGTAVEAVGSAVEAAGTAVEAAAVVEAAPEYGTAVAFVESVAAPAEPASVA